MDNLTLALKLTGKEKATEEKSESLNPSTASIVYMIAVTASSGGEVVLMDEVEESAEWEDGDFTEVDEDGDFEEYISEDDPMEDVDDSVVDMTDGDGVDIEEAGGETIAYTVADYHDDAVAAYSEEEGEVVEDDTPDEDVTIDDVIDDGDAEVIPDVGELNEDDLPDEEATTDELSDDEYALTDDNSDDVSDEIEDAEVSDGYTVAECIGAVKEGDRVAVMVQNGKLTVIGVVGSGDEQEALRQQAEEAADEASEAAADAQVKAEQAQQQAAGAAQDATEAKQQADAANTAATNAQNAANTAAGEAQEALQKANDAQSKADTVEENMAEVNKEVADVKEDAVKLRADMETEIQTVKTTMSQSYATKDEVSTTETTLRKEITDSIAGIQTTFTQDYAKKTELEDAIVEATASLQTQITQNANSISLTAKSVEDIQVDITSQDGKIAAAQQAATDAQTVATQAKTDASEAQTAATNAQAQAQAANTAATQAQTEANEAKSKADEAQSLADSAKSDLAEAQAKLAEVEDNVAASAEDIAQAQRAVADAQAAVNTAQAAADKAKADAATAQSTADQAKTSASAANTAAANAQTKANEAKTAADNAQAAADEAKEDLEALEARVVTAETAIEQNSEAIALRATKEEVTALANRVSAAELKITDDAIISTVSGTYVSKTDASNTYSTKTELTQTATGLEAKITTAQNTANNAAKTATNFMSYDATNGLLIGNKSSGSWSGNRAQVTSSAFNVLDSSGTQLASFGTTVTIGKTSGTLNNVYIDSDSVDIRKGTTVMSRFSANQIDLGMDNKSTVVNLCGSAGTIRAVTSAGTQWRRLEIEAEHSIDLTTTGQMSFSAEYESDSGFYINNSLRLNARTPWSNNASSSSVMLSAEYTDSDGSIESNVTLDTGKVFIYADNHIESLSAVIRLEADDGISSCTIEANGTWISGDLTAYGDICLGTGNKSLMGTDINGGSRRLLNLNHSNNCVINYDGFVNDDSFTNIYGTQVNLYIPYGTGNIGVALEKPTSSSDLAGYFRPNKTDLVSLGTSSLKWYRLIQSHASVSTSDEREKENIVPLGVSPAATYSLRGESVDTHSELFDRLIPVQYNFIKGDNRICFGLIAQQVASAMAELGIGEDELDLVQHDSWTDEETGEAKDSYGLAYENLIALLIHEVQKLKQQIS